MGHDVIARPVVELFEAGIMLAETVAGKQDLVFLEIGEHAVRPVNHPGFQKGQGSFAQTQFLAVFNRLVIPFAGENAWTGFSAPFWSNTRFVFSDSVHHPRQAAGMVHFRVIADHNIDFLGIDNLGDIVEQLIGKLAF